MINMTRIPVTVMRGGTSKGVFINHEEMPVNKSDWEPFLLDIMGSPDQRQIDGLGGANSLTSKIAIIKKSDLKEADVDYTFAQVSISESLVDFKGNCGNISSAVGPYAIEQGLVQAVEPVTKVRIYNTNTKKSNRSGSRSRKRESENRRILYDSWSARHGFTHLSFV